MSHGGNTVVDQQHPVPAVAPDDAVLVSLAQAEAHYREVRASWERQAAEFRAAWERQARELRQAQEALAAAQASTKQLSTHLQTQQDQLAAERRTSERQRQEALRQQERANKLAALLKDIHRSFFSGDLYSLILRACLTLTGGTRGLYVTMRGEQQRIVRVRAAIGLDGYPAAPPSEYIKALCAKSVDENRTFVCNQDDGLDDLPAPRDAAETFRNCIVAPVVLLKHFDGIMIVADKASGEFEADDVETLVSVGDQAAIAVENMELQRELQSAYLSTVSVLADAVEAKDSYTQGHCEMVSRYARLTAERLSLSDYNRSVVCYAALLHDVGKIGVSDGVLNKPGLLSPEERELVRSHVRVGHSLISHVRALDEVADVVLHHHEWWNGTGYPDGLAGEEIPLAARIICVVDSYCAMITRRSYKEAFSDERARDELQRYAGTQFDPQVVQAFLEILDTPAAQDQDDDEDAECGLLPTFTHLYGIQLPVVS
jgi:putative nucleotidyltransferase with HDIG domain